MSDVLRLYRRREGDLLRSGRLILKVNEACYDLTQALLHSGDPVLLSSLILRGFFEPTRFAEWFEASDLKRARPIDGEDDLLPPMLSVEVGKIIALGKNFAAHAAEFSEEVPKEPLFFNKLPEGLIGHNQLVSSPPGYDGRLDHEVELAVVIGHKARAVSVNEAHKSISGYSIANDLTLRTMQKQDRERRHPWFRSKNFEGACPLGPCFVPEPFLNTNALEISSRVNGELRQSGNTKDLVVSIPQAIAYLSNHFTLNSGDIILMGTPAGVGPLAPGDEIVCAIEGIGELRTKIGRNVS